MKREPNDEVAVSGLGERIRARRVALGLTLQQLGDRARIDVSQLSKLERGVGSTAPDTIDSILRELGLSLRLAPRRDWWPAGKGKQRSSRRRHGRSIAERAVGS